MGFILIITLINSRQAKKILTKPKLEPETTGLMHQCSVMSNELSSLALAVSHIGGAAPVRGQNPINSVWGRTQKYVSGNISKNIEVSREGFVSVCKDSIRVCITHYMEMHVHVYYT